MDTSTARIERCIAPRTPIQTSNKIPAIIHQTFKAVDIPERMHAAAKSWVECNPGYEYRFHDNDACRSFIKQHFDGDVLSAYDKLEYGAFRADLWRYCMLSVEGGVYADIDTLCQTDLNLVIKSDDSFVVPNAGNLPYAVFNAFICATPGHPFLIKAVERATALIHSPGRIDGYMTTGPGNLGISMNQYMGRTDQSPHMPGTHQHAGDIYRILEKTQTADGVRHVVDGETVVFLTKYDGYLDDLETSGIDHWAGDPKDGGLRRHLKKLVKSLLGRSS